MNLRIGVDSAENKKLSGFVLGFDAEVNKIYNALDKIFVNCGQKGVFHWKSLSKKVKKCASEKLFNILKNSKLRFLIFEHKKPRGVSEKEFYLTIVPNEISAKLERQLKGKPFTIFLECDDDFFIKKVKDGTNKFIEELLKRLTFRLSGKMTKILRTREFLKADIKQHPSKLTTFYGKAMLREESKAIQIADLILGLYRFLPRKYYQKYFKVSKI